MSILEASASVPAQELEAPTIAGLRAAFDAQRDAFAGDRNPTLDERRRRIEALIGMMLANRQRISAALSQDFGAHPVPASDLIEVLGVVGRARYVLANLEAWMAPIPRETDPAFLGTSRAYIQSQPKGVIGNISPWNFPFDLSVGPMIEMLAAGNRVMVKPSEFTPACSALLAEMVAATFDPTLVQVVTGGLEVAQAFSALPWDHLLYTGSPNVGRQVMAAAARNLTPVTLELGGKCPALLTPGSVSAVSVESVIGTKIIKNGQMCVSVDYCLVHRSEVEDFVDYATAFMHTAAPSYSRSDECTGIISTRHLERLQALLQEGRDHHARIVTLERDQEVDPTTRRMPMSLVIDPDQDLGLMREEIFGPILPVVVYDDLEAAIATINAGERPLGLYVFGDQAVADRVLAQTSSGGAAINTCAMQSALPSLAFGGVGMSGMGRHHGVEGFREFSNPRGVFVRGEGDMIDAFYSPYAKAAAVVQAVLSSGHN
ncbi:aldehyde dehydrogenase family protein [Caulobacter sp. DWR1-3-2b1]|uniref:aldehyde dehydrogenase family protein n=1 Tax=Caulobacter sp. DWR1-3-2b1 TaxID=2804670 RepID=UPI003CEA5018